MKISNLVGEFLKEQGLKHVFVISGGASLHLIHGIAETEGIDFICPQNEQAASFAADSYARLKGLGCAIATSGPGATNLVTGIATSFYDSIPVLYLTGNQTRERLNNFGTRQYGFQACPIVEIVRPITKYAVQILKPEDVIPTLTDALEAALSDRKGPVLVDIPDDVQRCTL